MSLYHSPKGLYPFQAEGIAKWLIERSLLCTWETGCGKSHLCLAGGAILVEDEMAGLIVVVCEQNKLSEFENDFKKFTKMAVMQYRGDKARRMRILDAVRGEETAIKKLKISGRPQVLVMTYETSRNDLGRFSKQKVDGRTKKVWVEGPLTELLREVASSGVAFIYDESSRLGGRYQEGHARKGRGWVPQRGSVTYKAHEHVLKVLRSLTEKVWVAALTATPVETSPENAFNQVRLIAPHIAGTVSEWEKNYIRYRDNFDRASYKNISPDSLHREPWVTPFSEVIKPILSHKKKTDPDIRAAFPEAVEEPLYVEMTKEHRALYDAVEALADDEILFPGGMSKTDQQVLFGILRQIASHPMALAISPAAEREGTLANLIVSRVGVDALSKIKSSKEEELVSKLNLLVRGQGSQVVVFTYFGRSTLQLLKNRLEAEGFKVAPYRGGMSQTEKDEAQSAFRRGDYEVFLSSDAGARGLNLPEAQYVINYEMCLTHAKTTQRINRISRLGSGHASITAFSMIALDTIEEQIFRMNIKRQEWHEDLLSTDDEESASRDEVDDLLGTMDSRERQKLFSRKRTKAQSQAEDAA